MHVIILAGLQRAALGLMGSILTEKLFARVMARMAVSILEWLVKSTKTTVDDEAVAPLLEKLKEHY